MGSCRHVNACWRPGWGQRHGPEQAAPLLPVKPGMQVHCVTWVAPVDAVLLPVGQLEHTRLAWVSLYVPALHDEHELASVPP